MVNLQSAVLQFAHLVKLMLLHGDSSVLQIVQHSFYRAVLSNCCFELMDRTVLKCTKCTFLTEISLDCGLECVEVFC